VQLNFFRTGDVGWYRLAIKDRHLLQHDTLWQCVLPLPGVAYFRIPDAHKDKWVALAERLTGLSEDELKSRGVVVYDTTTKRYLQYL